MNEVTWRLAVPTAAFDDLLRRPFGGRMPRHVHMENLPADVMDHEEHVWRSKRDGLDTKEVARPDARCVLRQEGPPAGRWPSIMGWMLILRHGSAANFEPKPLPVPPGSSADPKVGSRRSCAGLGSAAPAESGGGLCDMNAGANTPATHFGASVARFRVSQRAERLANQ